MARIGELIGPNGEVMHPKTSASVVYLEDGRSVEQVLSDDIDYGSVVFQDNSYKFDSDVEDDFAKTVVIKGQTYQNILPEPSTHVLTNNKEMFKVNEGLDPNVEIVDGVSKSAILKGQTLVNVLSYTKVGGNVPLVKNGNVIEVEATTENTWRSVDIDFTYLKPNTKYIVTWDSIIFSNTDFVPTSSLISVRLKTDNTQIAGWDSSRNYIIATVPSDTSNVKLRVHASQGTAMINKTTVKGLKVLEYVEGMENWDIPYFEGMTSCKMPVLTTVGKNLFDYSSHPITLEKLAYADGQQVYWTGYIGVKTYVPVKENTTYTYSNDINVGIHFGLVFYDDDKSVLSYINNFKTNNSFTSFTTPKGCKFIRFAMETQTIPQWIQLEEATSPTSYEPYRTNILSTPEEVVLRSLPNGVKDTLNLNTGEYVKRIGEVVLNGSENWDNAPSYINGNPRFCYDCSNLKVRNNVGNQLVLTNSDTIISVPSDVPKSATKGVFHHNTVAQIHIFIPSSEIGGTTPSNFKTYLQQNPVTVQYELANPVIKTVDLSSSGNWEKIVLNGSETGWSNSYSGWANKVFCLNNRYLPNVIKPTSIYGTYVMCDKLRGYTIQWLCAELGRTGVALHDWANGYLQIAINGVNTVDELKQYLSQNPITVWYQTATTLDSTQVKQPIFFKDGHIQLSSGADHSLIPTLNYQAKTSNSYVMDLMKTNTKYTMKAKTASGTFTIDGTSYGAGTNGTFTTPSSMTNKLLVMSSKTNEEVMILEGDVVSKTIPYFKGIKSAFEDEDKIEVLSQGKNLWDEECEKDVWINNEDGRIFSKSGCFVSSLIPIKKGKTYYRDVPEMYYNTYEYDKNGNFIRRIGAIPFTASVDGYFRFCWISTDIIPTYVIESSTSTTYEHYKSNNTKIPLLSPLRSLPNGVCDEIILDRENNKTKIIQRVGKAMITTPQVSKWYMDNNGVTNVSRIRLEIDSLGARKGQKQLISNLVPATGRGFHFDEETTYTDDTQNYWLWLHVSNNRLPAPTIEGFKSWLSQNPLVTYYELENPVITEVDLEGFPYLYKDGHIFLNGEIAPTVGIEYSLNQGQRISGQVETLQRHEKQFSKLEQYFADLVYSDYNFALLRFSEKLRQQEGDV